MVCGMHSAARLANLTASRAEAAHLSFLWYLAVVSSGNVGPPKGHIQGRRGLVRRRGCSHNKAKAGMVCMLREWLLCNFETCATSVHDDQGLP